MLRIDDDRKYFFAKILMRFDVDSNASSVVSKAFPGWPSLPVVGMELHAIAIKNFSV
jgi:hypothetical protein